MSTERQAGEGLRWVEGIGLRAEGSPSVRGAFEASRFGANGQLNRSEKDGVGTRFRKATDPKDASGAFDQNAIKAIPV